MEAEERPTKLRKLEYSVVDGDRPTAEDDLANGVPPAKMAVDDHGNEAKNFKSAPADATETNEPDASVAEISGAKDNEDCQKREESFNSALPLSKHALKRIRNKERWDAGRDARKLKRKQKIAEKRIRKRAAREEAQAVEEEATRKEKPKRPRYTRLPIAFVIDCGFDDLMTEREMISLGSQLTRSYSENHKALFQAHLFVSSWGGQLRERFNTVLDKHHENWRGVTFVEEDFVEAAARAKELMNGRTGGKLAGAFAIGQHEGIGAPNGAESSVGTVVRKGAVLKEQDTAAQESEKQETGVAERPPMVSAEDPKEPQNDVTKRPVHATNEEIEVPEDADADKTTQTPSFQAAKEGEIVYLTSDSPHTLERLQPYSTYIVGGLVDKNRHKGICYKTACDRGIKTAKLPIGKFMEMQSRFVLATNHVVEIMLRWLECGDWGQSLVKVMPKRKGGVLKSASGSKQDKHGAELDAEDMAPRCSDDEEVTAVQIQIQTI